MKYHAISWRYLINYVNVLNVFIRTSNSPGYWSDVQSGLTYRDLGSDFRSHVSKKYVHEIIICSL